MRFVDEATIEVCAGKGGDGCLSFRRERGIPKGGPDGGNGGDGGSVYLKADPQLVTLLDYRYRRLHRAANGQPGMGKMRHGKNGADLVLPTPTGVSVIDADSGELIGRLEHDEQELVVARGGLGGAGNTCFKSSTNRAPRKFTKGKGGETRRVLLNLELLADVGLVGLPNAGKSTLLRALSNSRTRVGAYPFTTKYPELGVVERGDSRLIVADVPGLVEGASQGAGMGHKFLKHLGKTNLLLHLVDGAAGAVAEQISVIASELQQYSSNLAQLPRWLVVNKVDSLSPEQLHELKQHYPQSLYISALCGQGVPELCNALCEHQQQHSERLASDSDYQEQQQQRQQLIAKETQLRLLSSSAAKISGQFNNNQ